MPLGIGYGSNSALEDASRRHFGKPFGQLSRRSQEDLLRIIGSEGPSRTSVADRFSGRAKPAPFIEGPFPQAAQPQQVFQEGTPPVSPEPLDPMGLHEPGTSIGSRLIKAGVSSYLGGVAGGAIGGAVGGASGAATGTQIGKQVGLGGRGGLDLSALKSLFGAGGDTSTPTEPTSAPIAREVSLSDQLRTVAAARARAAEGAAPPPAMVPAPAGAPPARAPLDFGSIAAADPGRAVPEPGIQTQAIGIPKGAPGQPTVGDRVLRGILVGAGQLHPATAALSQRWLFDKMEEERQQRVMHEVSGVSTKVNKLLAKGNFEGASNTIADALSHSRTQEPQAVQGLLRMMGQVTELQSAQRQRAQISDLLRSNPQAAALFSAGVPIERVATLLTPDVSVSGQNIISKPGLFGPAPAAAGAPEGAREVTVGGTRITQLPKAPGERAANQLDLLTSSASRGRYGSLESALAAGDTEVVDSVREMIKSEKVDVSERQGLKAMERQLEKEDLRPPTKDEIFLETTNLEYGKPVRQISGKSMGELRRLQMEGKVVAVDDVTRRYIRQFEAIETLIPEIERVIPQLPAEGGWGVLANRLKFPLYRGLGIAGPQTAIGALQGLDLVLARVLQGAASQLSNVDREVASYLNIKDSDSQATIKVKMRILKRVAGSMKAGFLGVDLREKKVFTDAEIELARESNMLDVVDMIDVAPGVRGKVMR